MWHGNDKLILMGVRKYKWKISFSYLRSIKTSLMRTHRHTHVHGEREKRNEEFCFGLTR